MGGAVALRILRAYQGLQCGGADSAAGDGIGALRQYLPLLAAKADDTVLTLEPHLADFVGLAGLEEDGDRSAVGQVMRFPDNRAAFDYAADCLRGILSDINV